MSATTRHGNVKQQTRQALKRRVHREIERSGGTMSSWAEAHGLLPTTVNDLLLDKSMSLMRFNMIRVAMGMEAVGVSKAAGYISRQVRLTPDEAAAVDEWLAERGYASFNAWWHAEGRHAFYGDAS